MKHKSPLYRALPEIHPTFIGRSNISNFHCRNPRVSRCLHAPSFFLRHRTTPALISTTMNGGSELPAAKPKIVSEDDLEAEDWLEPTYVSHEGGESLEYYRPGGYHPVHIGDKYKDDRYEIIYKLGSGSFSTVWLSKDHHQNRYVALKVVCADDSSGSSEKRVLEHLATQSKQIHTNKKQVALLLDEFFIEGPNGRHLCLVTEPARCSVLSSLAEHPWMFQKPIARAIAAQTILGLQSLHQNGVIHGGESLTLSSLAMRAHVIEKALTLSRSPSRQHPPLPLQH